MLGFFAWGVIASRNQNEALHLARRAACAIRFRAITLPSVRAERRSAHDIGNAPEGVTHPTEGRAALSHRKGDHTPGRGVITALSADDPPYALRWIDHRHVEAGGIDAN
jgi:hypothetical protein